MRPAIHPDTLRDLIDAHQLLDCQLQLALFRAGIMAETDLDRVRLLLGHTPIEVRSSLNSAGQRQLSFACDGTLVGVVDGDGQIRHFTAIERANPIYVASQNINVVS